MSVSFEQGLTVRPGTGGVTLAVVGLAARSRRLLQAAYKLIDAGDRDMAAPLFRVMNEYYIVSRWLLKVGDEEFELWALDDLRGQLTVLRRVAADPQLAEIKATIDEQIRSTEDAIRRYGGSTAPLTKRAAKKAGYATPKIEAMAKLADLDFVYGYAFRLLSQIDVHATPAAVDSAFDQTDEGPRLRPIPRFGLEGYDSYLVGAHLLLDILQPLAERLPELGWQPSTSLVSETLAAISRADPESSRT